MVVLFGDTEGLNQGSTPATLLTQDTTDMPDSAEQDDYFGASVTTGDFNGDGVSELAIGVPGQSAPPPDTEAYSSGIRSDPRGWPSRDPARRRHHAQSEQPGRARRQQRVERLRVRGGRR